MATISHSPLPRRLAARRRGSRVVLAVPLMCPTRVAHRARLRRKSVASDHARADAPLSSLFPAASIRCLLADREVLIGTVSG
ncbi:hypothetical protein NKH95_29560 [Mesorhizobium sp. M0848]|uniref:hypothetical protein n=1 Tax=Mesorhizobium sp. M0848 TaxID=2957012 RepID=UPI0033382C30